MIKSNKLAIRERRFVAAAVHPVMVFPLPTGSIFTRLILNPGHVISVAATAASAQRSAANNDAAFKKKAPRNKVPR